VILEIQEKTGASIRKICQVLHVPRSGFYHAAQSTEMQRLDGKIADRIEIIFKENRSRYGYRRIWREIIEEGWICSPRRVRRLMKKRSLRAISPKKFIPKTSDGKALEPAPNLLKHRPLPQLPNEVWTADITYIPSRIGWLYLAIVMDLYSRKILGWKLANHMRSELVLQSFEEALDSTGDIPKSAIFHSDRGSQYGSHAFRRALKRAGFCQSMSARSNPYDNAWTESFFGSFKREMLQKGSFDNFQDAQTATFEYINGYYNTHRKHSALGYMTPVAFERKTLIENQTLLTQCV